MTSPLPPKRRDSRNLADLLRQDRQRLNQLDRGLIGGRFPPARPIKPRFDDGSEDDDGALDDILFENRDRVVASGPGAVSFRLSHEPLDGSLHVRWNGVDQPPSEWSLSGQVVTLPDPYSLIAAGDVFTAAYAYEDGEPDVLIPSIEFIGYTTAEHSISSIGVHPNTQAGDLLVLASAAWTSTSSSDPRLPNGITVPSNPGIIRWGFADGSHTPVAVSVNSGPFDWASTVLAVFRGVNVASSALSTAATDITLPVIAGSNAAIGVVLGWNGTSAGNFGGTGDTTGMWTTRAWDDSAKTHILITSWADLTTQSTPAGAFHMGGDGATAAATLQLGGI